jgi:single-stranded-DNA-specific exonuclease
MTSHLRVANGSRMVGKENDVMRLLLEDENGNRFLAVGFGMKNLEKTVFKASYVDICYVIEENYFRGNTSLQLRLKDIR